MKQKYFYTVLVISICVLVTFALLSRPHLTVSEIPGTTAADFASDSTFRDERQMGLVSLDKFIELASRLGDGLFNAENNLKYNNNGDSVSISLSNTNKSDILFGEFTNVGQLQRISSQYKEFPINIINDGTGFRAEVAEIGDRQYIKIPYFVLTSLAKYVYGESSSTNMQTKVSSELPTINLQNSNQLFNKQLDNKKIQTEGVVMRNFSDIQSMRNKNKESDPIKQLKFAWEYVNEHWLYINDPTTNESSDTWRSASETVTNYYSNGHLYTGDCDDYAILMASFARQCGLESRLVCAFEGDEGHMYAEFKRKDEKDWHNLDWGMPFDAKERYGKPEHILNDL